MQHLITHARNFQSRIAHLRADFERLAEGQQPHALFVSCSDSRVVPTLITNAVPGEVFELRTAGNIVPRHRPGVACGVGATLEFALEVLEVLDIVVCGHSHCGAVQSIVRGHTPGRCRWFGAGSTRPSFVARHAAWARTHPSRTRSRKRRSRTFLSS